MASYEGFSYLKKLQNFILRILRAWSLFCSMRIYISLHFVLNILNN